MEPKKLYKSKTQRMICGVCGGIAEYINLYANIVRLIAVVLGLSGAGLLIYIIAAIILPEQE
jgi:phage shock protein PspC (stress-responsive transcriptional regulator)